jgi:two-component system cell cycle response regulator DivK
MNGLVDDPAVLAGALVLASGLGGLIGFMLRGWYDDARRSRRAGDPLTGAAASTPGSGYRTTHPPAGVREYGAWEHADSAPERDTVVVGVPREEDRPVVLLVDDRLELLALHGSYLHRHGYTVLTADNGDAALELARSHRPGVIVLDHSMPGRSGIEVARELKRDAATASIPLLMMTAHSYGAVGTAAREAGFDMFLPKPVDPSRMLREVAALVPPR